MKYLFLTLLTLTSLTAQAKPKNYGSAVISEVRSIYDGDTFKATIDGWPPIIGETVGIRVNGVDTPEMRGNMNRKKIDC